MSFPQIYKKIIIVILVACITLPAIFAVGVKPVSAQAAPSDSGGEAHACYYTIGGVLPAFSMYACTALVANLGLMVTSWAVGFSGAVLNTSIDYSVNNMHKYVTGNGAVNNAWKQFRDIANMAFIFIILYISIITIVRADTEQTKHILVRVIIIGILINFSFLFTSLIIDGSNIIATSFYKQSLNIGTSGESLGISSKLMGELKLPTLYNTNGVGYTTDSSGKSVATQYTWLGIVIVGVAGSITFLIVAFVFLATAVLFIIRLVMLLLLLVVSPLAYAAHILPATEKHSQRWWSSLFNNVIFAPVYMILLAVSISLISSVQQASGGISGNLASGLINSSGGGTIDGKVWVNFLIIIVFLVATLLVAKELGAKGASSVISRGNKLFQGAQKRLKQGGGAAMRGTVGGVARRADNAVGNTRFGNTWVGNKFRGATTGFVAKQKWGTKKDAFKARKDEDKNVEERRGKTAEILHTNLDKAKEKASTKTNIESQKINTAQAEKTRLEAELAALKRQKSSATTPSNPQIDSQIAAKEAALKAKQDEVRMAQTKQTQTNQKAQKDITAAEEAIRRAELNQQSPLGKKVSRVINVAGTVGGVGLGMAVGGPLGALAGGVIAAEITRRRSVVRNLITRTNDTRKETSKILLEYKGYQTAQVQQNQNAKKFKDWLKDKNKKKKNLAAFEKVLEEKDEGDDEKKPEEKK